MYDVRLLHGEKSRISNRIVEKLKANDLLKVKTVKTLQRNRKPNEEVVFEHWITLNDRSEIDKLKFVRNEILAVLSELFPINYFFKFSDPFSTLTLFNYKLEFRCETVKDNYFEVFTKINEQRKNSKKITSFVAQL